MSETPSLDGDLRPHAFAPARPLEDGRWMHPAIHVGGPSDGMQFGASVEADGHVRYCGHGGGDTWYCIDPLNPERNADGHLVFRFTGSKTPRDLYPPVRSQEDSANG